MITNKVLNNLAGWHTIEFDLLSNIEILMKFSKVSEKNYLKG